MLTFEFLCRKKKQKKSLINYCKELGNFSKIFKAVEYKVKVQKINRIHTQLSRSGGKQNCENNI